MDYANQALKLTVAALVLSNETLFISRLWIVSKPPPTWPAKYLVNPIVTTIVYALSEPLWTALFRNIPIPPPLWSFPSAMLLMYLSFVHTMTGIISGVLICDLMNIIPRRHTRASSESKPARITATEGPKPVWIYPIFLVPVQTAAICNAALILWSHDLHYGIPPTNGGAGLDLFIHIFALFSYVGFGLGGDFTFSESSYRALFFRSGNLLLSQLGHLGLLLVLRICVRKMVGLEFFPVLPTL